MLDEAHDSPLAQRWSCYNEQDSPDGHSDSLTHSILSKLDHAVADRQDSIEICQTSVGVSGSSSLGNKVKVRRK